MSLFRWRIGLGLVACVLALAGRAAAQDSPKHDGRENHSHQHEVYHNLTSVHNYGANLYNNGDWAGCYRFFEGSLMTLLPHLEAHHADLHKSVKDALALAQADPSMVNRAWILREALLKVRKAHKESSGKTEDHPKTRPDDLPRTTPEEPPPVTKKTLWDRLGGEKGVSHIVDDIVTTAARDPKVNFFRGGKVKLDAAGMRRFKQHMVQEASALTGGPLHYEGEDMRKAHKGMGITNAEFDAFMGHVKDALEKNKVSPADAATITSALNARRKDIVEDKKPADKTGDKKPGDKNIGDKKPEDKKPGDKMTDPFEPRTDKKPKVDRPEDKKPADIKTGKQGRVSGKVMFQGAPLVDGKVGFHPATGKSITAKLEADGTYSVDVLPGEYKVTIEGEKIKVPAKYKDKSTTALRVNVKAGEQIQDLDLKP